MAETRPSMIVASCTTRTMENANLLVERSVGGRSYWEPGLASPHLTQHGESSEYQFRSSEAHRRASAAARFLPRTRACRRATIYILGCPLNNHTSHRAIAAACRFDDVAMRWHMTMLMMVAMVMMMMMMMPLCGHRNRGTCWICTVSSRCGAVSPERGTPCL